MFRSLLDSLGPRFRFLYFYFYCRNRRFGHYIVDRTEHCGDWIGLGTSKEGSHLVSFFGF